MALILGSEYVIKVSIRFIMSSVSQRIPLILIYWYRRDRPFWIVCLLFGTVHGVQLINTLLGIILKLMVLLVNI